MKKRASLKGADKHAVMLKLVNKRVCGNTRKEPATQAEE